MTFDQLVIVIFYCLLPAMIAACFFRLRRKATGFGARFVRAAMYFAVSVLVWEVCSLVALRVNTGMWIYAEEPNPNGWLFEEQHHLVAIPKPKMSYEANGNRVSHNSLGFRGPEIPPKSEKIRVIAIGGSTTYSVLVSDAETFPASLADELGSGYEVINMGVPGHSTAEHLYLVGAIASRFEPDVVLLLIGLNDMHCMHDPRNTRIENVCHSTSLTNYLGLCYLNKVPRLAGLRTFLTVLQNLGVIPRCDTPATLDGIHREIDTDVAASFRRQAVALVSMVRGMGAKPILIPQVGFDKERIALNYLAPWTPHLDKSRLSDFQHAFNSILKDVAITTGADYVGEVETFSWSDSLFVDASHLGGKGNKSLAQLVSPYVTRMNRR